MSICLFIYQMPLYLSKDYIATSIVESNIFYKIKLENKTNKWTFKAKWFENKDKEKWEQRK